MHHNNFGNFYTREIYAIPIPIGFIPIPIPIMSRTAIPIPFPWGFPLPCTPLMYGTYGEIGEIFWRYLTFGDLDLCRFDL